MAGREVIAVVTGRPVAVRVTDADTVLDMRRRAVAALGYDDGPYWCREKSRRKQYQPVADPGAARKTRTLRGA